MAVTVSTARATACGVAALALWSGLALLTSRVATLPPFQLTSMTFALAALLAAAKWLTRREDPRRFLRLPAIAWAHGVGGLFGYHALYFAAFARAPASEANLISYLWPLLIVLFAGLLPGARLAWRQLAGAGLGFLGVVLLTGAGADFRNEHALGYGLALGSAVVWAGYSVLSRRLAAVPTDAVGAFCAVTALLALVAHLAFEQTRWPDATGWGVIVLLGLGPVGLAFYLWDRAMKRGAIALLGALAYATPVASTALLVGFGLADLDWRLGAACMLISAGAAFAAWRGAVDTSR